LLQQQRIDHLAVSPGLKMPSPQACLMGRVDSANETAPLSANARPGGAVFFYLDAGSA